jgi:hypothetical protein
MLINNRLNLLWSGCALPAEELRQAVPERVPADDAREALPQPLLPPGGQLAQRHRHGIP